MFALTPSVVRRGSELAPRIRVARVRVERVRTLNHPDAYPIAFVTLRRLGPVAPITAAFVKYLKSPRTAAALRGRGMLPAKGPWPAAPQPADDQTGT